MVDVILRLDLLYPNFHSLLPKANVLLLHLLRSLLGDICGNGIYDVANECSDREHYEEDEERNDLGEDGHVDYARARTSGARDKYLREQPRRYMWYEAGEDEYELKIYQVWSL